MNLVQKLPIGLSMACLMFMSSCSKEDAQTPEPLKGERTDANMRGIGGGVIALPTLIFPTHGLAGFDVFPSGWKRSESASSNKSVHPAGTSTTQHLWGNFYQPWDKLLLKGSENLSVSSIVTVTTRTNINLLNDASTADKRSAVETTIKHLKPGKKYELTVYLATSKPMNANDATYATYLALDWNRPSGIVPLANEIVNQSKQAIWIPKSIIFEATDTQEVLRFTAYTNVDNTVAYGHIYVGENAIKELP